MKSFKRLVSFLLAFFFLLYGKPIILMLTEHLTAIVLVGNQIIIPLLGRLGKPITFFLVGTMFPTERQIIGTEQLGYGKVGFSQAFGVLTVKLPAEMPTSYTNCLKIEL